MFSRVIFDEGHPDATKVKIAEEIQSCAQDGYILVEVKHIDDIIALYFEEQE